MDYRVTEGYTLKKVTCGVSSGTTIIQIEWEDNPDVTQTRIANWKTKDYTQQEIENEKMIVAMWNDAAPPSAVIETRATNGMPYVPGSDCHVLLFGWNRQGEVCAEIVVKLGYPTV